MSLQNREAPCQSDTANAVSSKASIQSKKLRRGRLSSDPGSQLALDEEVQRFADLCLAAYKKMIAYSKSDSHFDNRMQTICDVPQVAC